MNKSNRVIKIDPLSKTSLRIEMLDRDERAKGMATGFIVEYNKKEYLITNKYVVKSKELNIRKLRVYFHGHTLGSWVIKVIEIYKEEENLWLEHAGDKNIDVVAIPLDNLEENVKIYPLDLNLANSDILLEPSMAVSIIGYPAGISTGVNFPIWKKGHIASDPDLDYNSKPLFLIDATTRGGMSGSPVVVRISGTGFRNSSGSMVFSSGTLTKFLGIYSGRITDGRESIELGFVWRPSVILEILNQK